MDSPNEKFLSRFLDYCLTTTDPKDSATNADTISHAGLVGKARIIAIAKWFGRQDLKHFRLTVKQRE